jgi:glycolate oxidase FAD binding subunit
VAGSLGALGVVTQVALKLWPRGRHATTISVDDGDAALAATYRPLAVIETDGVARVFLAGTEAELEAQAAALGGQEIAGLQWPEPVAGDLVVVVRVPAASTRAAIDRVPAGWSYQASLGVGEVAMAGSADGVGAVIDLRDWAERAGGAAVVADAPFDLYEAVDPWGDPGPALGLQRRVKAAFDPLGVCNPGRLPGGL